MPKIESFTLTSLQDTKPELIVGNYYSVSFKVKKGVGQTYLDNYTKAVSVNETKTFQFYSPSGFLVEVPIVLLSLTEYHDQYPYDVLDITIDISPEVGLMLSDPNLDLFNY